MWLPFGFGIDRPWRPKSPSDIDAPIDKRGLIGRLIVVFLGMFVAQAVGTAYNISYNLVHITPLLSEAQAAGFDRAIARFNLVTFSVLVSVWAWIVFSLADGQPKRRRRVINLPWWAVGIAAVGWAGCVPVLMLQLAGTGEAVGDEVKFHLPVSVLTASGIALSLGYLVVDWLRARLLFAYFFSEGGEAPARIVGGHGLSVTGRGVLWMISASLCPIVALWLLLMSPAEASKNLGFALSVAGAGVFFAVAGAILLHSLVAEPVREIRAAAQAVGEGRLDVAVSNLRADEFGILADEFNTMVAGLREKERIRNTFGLHVGEKIANELLGSESELAGVERVVSVLFCDVRGFTTRCEGLEPKQAVQFLNLYHEAMTAVIDAHGGIVNQIVGDGFMSIFGATGRNANYAGDAVAAGRAMLQALEPLNEKLVALDFDPVCIGIGIHTGPAVVGTIGSPGRMEYTAIGDTVNTAARIEAMTKDLGHPLLVSASTWEQLESPPPGRELPPQTVRGREHGIVLWAVEG